MRNIGIVCEGPTDYIILKGVIDKITGEQNTYVMLQPEANLIGQFGNGWKGVWKWCHDNAGIRTQLMQSVQPVLDLLIVQMDGDVSRKEKSAHCWCHSVPCEYREIRNPLECDVTPEGRASCPIILPCPTHPASVAGYMTHLKQLLTTWLHGANDACIVIPCDSTEAWVVAAYDRTPEIESVADPWEHIIARSKFYHDIRIPGQKKRTRIFEQFAPVVCENWALVTELCESARDFEQSLLSVTQ